MQNIGIGKTQEFSRIAGAKQRIEKLRKTAGIVVWMEHMKKKGKVPLSYANECKKEVIVDVKISMGLRCRNAIHRNFGGDIHLIQRHSLGKNPMD